jgi:DNA-binding NarL/FixJ family response regulator
VTRVLIVDDQDLMRAGLRMILESEPDIEVVGEAADGVRAVEIVKLSRPDIVLMDIRMPGMDGIEATRRITAAPSCSRVVVLTTFGQDEYVYEAIRAGASGFLLKTSPPGELVRAVRAVAAGDALLTPSVTRRLIEEFVRRVPANRSLPPSLAQLTGREREVLLLVGRGFSNQEIAERLHLGEATVKTHLGRVLDKLELRDRVQAVVLAYETRLVEPGDSSLT